ncbi:MAG: Sec-independent protein translocase protein TatB [Pseudomonadota bacterium]
MFEISFWELVLCFIVALVVLGPERLPPIAKALGRWTGQARVYLRNLSSELERETQASELKRQLEEAKRKYDEQAGAFKKEMQSLTAPVTEAPQQPETPKTP